MLCVKKIAMSMSYIQMKDMLTHHSKHQVCPCHSLCCLFLSSQVRGWSASPCPQFPPPSRPSWRVPPWASSIPAWTCCSASTATYFWSPASQDEVSRHYPCTSHTNQVCLYIIHICPMQIQGVIDPWNHASFLYWLSYRDKTCGALIKDRLTEWINVVSCVQYQFVS